MLELILNQNQFFKRFATIYLESAFNFYVCYLKVGRARELQMWACDMGECRHLPTSHQAVKRILPLMNLSFFFTKISDAIS